MRKRSRLLLSLAAFTLTASSAAAVAAVVPDAAGTTGRPAVAVDPGGPKGITSPLAETVWLCRPGLPTNPCNQDTAGNPQRSSPGGAFTVRYFNGVTTTLDATRVQTDGSRTPEPFAGPANPAVDCFYAYPTVDLLPNPLLRVGSLPPVPSDSELAVTLTQLGRFTDTCRVFAPVYRQASLTELLAGGIGVPSDPSTGVRDVRDAWRDYWANHNTDPVTGKRRGVVVLGHSQGTGATAQMMQQEIDNNPAVQDRLVSAVLLGGNVRVPIGGTHGGGSDPNSSFQHIPTCVRPAGSPTVPTGCIVAYSAFALPSGQSPPPGAVFGRDPVPGHQVACVNPAALLRGTAQDAITPLNAYLPTRRLLDGNWLNPRGHLAHLFSAYTPVDDPSGYTRYQDKFGGQCSFTQDATGTASWFNVTGSEGVIPDALLSGVGGMHTSDYSLTLGDLSGLISAQASAWRAAHPG